MAFGLLYNERMKKHGLCILALCVFVGLVTPAFSDTAEDLGNEGVKEEAISAQIARSEPVNIWRSIGAVIFVLGGLLAAQAFIRKRQFSGLKTSGNKRIKILERAPLDNRRSLVLVEADGRRILVGVGADRIESLADLGAEEYPEEWKPEIMRSNENS